MPASPHDDHDDRDDTVQGSGGAEPPPSAAAPISVSWDSQANVPTNVSKEIGPGLIVGEYRLEQLIGQGGMGAVYSAHHRKDVGRVVAIKILAPELVEDYNAVPRFMLEAKVASKLTSPNAVRVYDYGTLPSGVPYMVMELLEGDTLHAHLRAAPNNQLPAYVAVDYIVQACAAVGEAHEAGIIHRDLKLNNFLLAKKGDRCVLKVLDFGLAKPQRRLEENEPTQVSLTQAGAFFGTPQYMSPEQMIGVRKVDPRIDVWALGVCLYAMITGAYPFHGEDAQAICRMVLSNEFTPASDLRPDLSPEIEAVIKKCLSPMSMRYPNARALAEALRAVVPVPRDEPEADENWEDEVTRTPQHPLQPPQQHQKPHRQPPPPPQPSSDSRQRGDEGPASRTRILAAGQQPPAIITPAAQPTPPPPPVLAQPRPSPVTPQMPFAPPAAAHQSQPLPHLAHQSQPLPHLAQSQPLPHLGPQEPRARGHAPPPPGSGPALLGVSGSGPLPTLPTLPSDSVNSANVVHQQRRRRAQQTVMVPRREARTKRTLGVIFVMLLVVLMIVVAMMYFTGRLGGPVHHLGI